MATFSNITQTITNANDSTGTDEHGLSVRTCKDGWVAMIVDEDGNVITSEIDWDVNLSAEAKTMDAAITKLDKLCAKHLP